MKWTDLKHALRSGDQPVSKRDADLIEQLRAKTPSSEELNSMERARIESAWRRGGEAVEERPSWRVRGVWSAGVAVTVLVVLGLGLVRETEDRVLKSPEMAQTISNDAPETKEVKARPVVSLEGLSKPGVLEWTTQIDQPLTNEGERLIADLTEAVRFVAAGVVPESILPEVDSQIRALSERLENRSRS